MYSHNYYIYFSNHEKVIRSPHIVFHKEYCDPANPNYDDMPNDVRTMEKERIFPPWVNDLHGRKRPKNPIPKERVDAQITSNTPELRLRGCDHDPFNFSLSTVFGDPSTAIRDYDPWEPQDSGGINPDDTDNAALRGCADTAFPTVCNDNKSKLEFINDFIIYAIITDNDPKIVGEAMKTPHTEEWKKAMFNKIRQHLRRGTFRFMGGNVTHKLTCKWVFKEKRDIKTGKVFKRKARIVTRGFQQRAGVDYTKTFATTAIATSARILLAIAARKGLIMRYVNAVKVYLMGKPLRENIFVT